jgi:O-methyltransferase
MEEQKEKSLYVDLLKRILTRYQFEDRNVFVPIINNGWKEWLLLRVDAILRKRNHAIVRIPQPTNWALRAVGRDWPNSAETMVGLARLSQLADAITILTTEDIEGDIVEIGVWRGGASIFMTALLNFAGDRNRKVFIADSFEGFPPPSDEYTVDAGDIHHKIEFMCVSEKEVIENFDRYEIAMDRVQIVKGWFDETLESLPATKISLLRLDAVMYSSTMQALRTLYARVVPGGFVVLDDYSLIGVHTAVHDFLKQVGQRPVIIDIDGSGAYWRV